MSKTGRKMPAPYGLDAEEGSALWYLGTLLKVKATGRETNVKYSLVEEWCPRGFGTPWHVHGREDESFLMIDGGLRSLSGMR